MQKALMAIVALSLVAGCGRAPRERSRSQAEKDAHSAAGQNAADPPGKSASAAPSGVPTGASSDPIAGDADEVPLEVPLGGPGGDQPVVVAAAIFPPQARPGDVVTIAVRFRTALGWHFFAMDDKNADGPVTPTRLELDLPQGLSAEEDWVLPPAEDYLGPSGPGKVYEDDVTFRRRIRIGAQQRPGALTLPCRVNYQSCNDKMCLRPTPQTLEPKLEVVSRSPGR